MLSYLQKFNSLPPELRGKVSSPEVMRKIGELEKKYGVSLATVIMKLMVKDLSIVDLEKYFVFEHNLSGSRARQLVDDLKEKILIKVAEYLGFAVENRKSAEIAPRAPKDDSSKTLANWMAEKKQETSVRGSDFFFSPEDEEEVKELTKKIQGFPASAQKSSGIDNKIEQIIKETGLGFSSEDLANRCRQILKTYLKGVRNRIDTRQALSRSVESGGLGLDINTIEKVIIASDKFRDENNQTAPVKPGSEIKLPGGSLKTATDILKEVKSDFKQKEPSAEKKEALGAGAKIGDKTVSEEKGAVARDFDYDFSKFKKPPENASKAETSKPKSDIKQRRLTTDEMLAVYGEKKDPRKEWRNVLSSDKKIKLASPTVEEDNKKAKSETAADNSTIVSIKRPIKQKAREISGGKVKMEDVKYVPKLTGPIDELGEMDLVNFRRLADEPAEAAGKIKEKIEFLEEDSFARRLAGIKAWRQSPMNKLYLDIGRQSIESNKPISVIIKERKSSGKPAITKQEFDAVMNLNKSLRF